MIKLFGANHFIDVEFFTFPGGERHVKIKEDIPCSRFTVVCVFETNEDIIDMLLLVDAIRSKESFSRRASIRLYMPYVPYARQDRVMVEGEPFSLRVMANIIKSCDFSEIEVWDVHSDVFEGMFGPGVILHRKQHRLWADTIAKRLGRADGVVLVSPDGGAIKKIYKLANSLDGLFDGQVIVTEAQKQRDVTNGNIIGTNIDVTEFKTIPSNCPIYVVDDICDGGRTFIELGREIRRYVSHEQELNLCVTHGIFSKGKSDLLKYYNNVLSLDTEYLRNFYL